MKASINEDLAIALDPVFFARAVGLEPDEWQQKLLLSTQKRILLNCCRQSGKTTIVAVLALHHALNNPSALVLVLSPSLRQSSELFKKITGFYKDLRRPIPSETETALTLQLTNRSRIVSLPAKEQTVRGFSGVSLLLIDEAARVPDELNYAVRPMLAVSGGKIILLSTPHGKRGFFWETWSGRNDWLKIQIAADECPRLSKQFLKEEQETFPDWFFQQEYYNFFAEGTGSVFKAEDIDRAFKHDLFVRDEIDMELDDL
jgi:hypothetical protein